MPIVGQFGSLAGLGSLILPGGAMESIATVTVGSGGASSITFSDIPGGFQHLQVRIVARGTSTSARNGIEFNADTTRSNYRTHWLFGDGSSASAGTGTSYYPIGAHPPSSASASIFGATVVDILDYANTSKNTVWRTLSGYDTNGGGLVIHYSGLWVNTNAVTSIKLIPKERDADTGDFAQYTTAALYGLRAP